MATNVPNGLFSLTLVVSATVPLLRGAGDVAREDLIQAERNLVYAARTFEDFRRAYLVSITRDYLQLVLSQQAIRNQQNSIELLQWLVNRTRALVEADKSNRSIEIIADSPQFYRSSEVQLDGEYAPRMTRFEFRSMPSGEYDVRAVLKGDRGQALAVTETRAKVVESGPR